MRVHCFQHVPFEGLGSIEAWTRTTGSEVSWTRFFESDAVPLPDDVDLLVVLGGPMSANDDATFPWLAAERRWIREAIEDEKGVIGICLGAQLIARTMGARVYPNREREIGWWPIEGVGAGETHPAWAAVRSETMVFHWHGETFDLPPGAVHLARSAGCEHQGFRMGERVMGLQFHLESTPAGVRDMVSHGRDELAPSRFVQSESALLSADDARYEAANALMAETLDLVTRRVRSDGAPAVIVRS